jgi:hypothetical protein
MDAEYYNIDEFACKVVNKAKETGIVYAHRYYYNERF